MLVYALTIFLSAFLLFQVQPMIAKIILPWFGGSAAVWSTCMLFFQITLLLGYLYADAVVRHLRGRRQTYIHIALLAASLLLLPIYPSELWKPGATDDPTLRILLLLAATIGLPYFLLSTTGPLLQAWYLRRTGAIPYRLYALSNLASLLALITFPTAVEPFLTTHVQSWMWSGLYALFAVACAITAWVTPARQMTAETVQAAASGTSSTRTIANNSEESIADPPSWTDRLLWIALPACASALLLSVTNELSVNVAPIPFLWVLPLSLYLLTFILCFENERFYLRSVFIRLFAVAIASIAYLIYANDGNPHVNVAIPILSIGLFICCMVCHGELVRLKPDPRYLTTFYLMISVGGALGGLFVAVVAPHVFDTYLELPVSLIAASILIAVVLWDYHPTFARMENREFRIAISICCVILIGSIAYNEYDVDQRYVRSVRNFYGALRIRDRPETDSDTAARILMHGTIIHGLQLMDAGMRDLPTSYYGTNSGIGLAIRSVQQKSATRVGIVGLGAGVIASYCKPGDTFRYYELNPLAEQIAQSWFTFLKDCKADHQVYLGDARLVLEQQAPQNFDVLALDAFSSDAIPVHLLTREAFQVYFRHLKPNGILAVHVSNKYLDLVPVVAADGRSLGKTVMSVHDDGEEADYLYATTWVLVANSNLPFHAPLLQRAISPPYNTGVRPWTDDFSNLIQILK